MKKGRKLTALVVAVLTFVLSFVMITAGASAGSSVVASDSYVSAEATMTKAEYASGENVELIVKVKVLDTAMGSVTVQNTIPGGFEYVEGSSEATTFTQIGANGEATNSVMFSVPATSDTENSGTTAVTGDGADTTGGNTADTAVDTRKESAAQTSDTSGRMMAVFASLAIAAVAGAVVYFAGTKKAATLVVAVAMLAPSLLFGGAINADAVSFGQSTEGSLSPMRVSFKYDGNTYMVTVNVSYETLMYNAPTGYSTYTEPTTTLVTDADVYVATDGNDDTGDGSFEAPFATIERARDRVREIKAQVSDGTVAPGEIVVAIKGGTYPASDIRFSAEDSGTEANPITYCAYGDSEVIITGAVTVSVEDASQLTTSEKSMFNSDVLDKIVKIDLNQYPGIDVSALSNLNELFDSNGRCTIARYPNVNEDGSDNLLRFNAGSGDPDHMNSTTKMKLTSSSLISRIGNYHTLSNARICGYLRYDWWCDDSEIVSYDPTTKILTLDQTNYGVGNIPYFFIYNVSEELDAEGEYFLDTVNGILYLYDPAETEYKLSVNPHQHISGDDFNHVTFSGLTLECGLEDAATISGDHVTIERCVVRNFRDDGIRLNGDNNLITECVFYNMGARSVRIFGGDRETLTRCNSRVDNNLFYDFGQVMKTYSSAINATGCGITISHNEIYNAPHQAIGYDGNYITVEYNVIHDVVQQSSDAGAIYSGKDWTEQGSILRYNLLYNIGNSTYTGNGIYFDDGLSGQTAYGNILYNVAGNAFLIGGGRDINVYNNAIINGRIEYDARYRTAYDQVLAGNPYAQFAGAIKDLSGVMWENLADVPVTSAVWAAAFPTLKDISYDFDDYTNKDFPINPAYSEIKDNICVSDGRTHKFNDYVMQYSIVSNNTMYNFDENPRFADPNNGDYSIPNIVSIADIGRY